MLEAVLRGGRLFFCGNGGSAADAQHMAAELSGRYLLERRAIDAQALSCNSSAVTAVGNDYGYDRIFARQLEAHGRRGDVLVAISTSGTSLNVVQALERARSMGIHCLAMTGCHGRRVGELADVLIAVPSDQTPRIQEMHILIGHSLCQFIEAEVQKASNQ